MGAPKVNLPQSRKDKIRLLKDIQSGAVKIDDLIESGYEIKLYLDPLSPEELEKIKKEKNSIYVTLTL